MEHTHEGAAHESHENHSHAHSAHHETHHHAGVHHGKPGFTLTTPLAIVLAAIIIAVGLLGYGMVTRGGSSNGDATAFLESFGGKSPTEDVYREGSGKVYVIEYSDTQCPFCERFYQPIESLRKDYKDKITFLYRHFPLTSIHPRALPGAKAIECAGKLGGTSAYFGYMDNLFTKWSTTNGAFTDEDFATTAKELKLNATDFAKCVSDPNIEQDITASINDGMQAGVSGTPTTFIVVKTKDGSYKVIKNFTGATTESAVKPYIEQALKVAR